MDYNLIEQLIDLPRIKIKRIEFQNDEVLIWIYLPEGQHRCPHCGKYHHRVTETTEIKVRDLSIFGKPCYLIIQKGRVNCSCSFRGYEEIEFVDKYQRQTIRFTEFLFELCDRMTLMDASQLLRVNWKRAYKTDVTTLEQLKSATPLPTMYAIGIDEISFEKYHKYFTIVYDLTNNNGVLYVSKDRAAASLDKFFNELSPQQLQAIKVVCMDFWDPYIKSVNHNLNHATIVFDRYHLKKHLNDCIDNLRRAMVNQADNEQKVYIKNKRWVLLKNQVNHNEQDKQALEQLKHINNPLYEAYLLKEQFDEFFDCPHKKSGRKFIKNWYQSIPNIIKSYFEPFYNMIMRYLDGVLAYLEYRYTNAVAEGLNNKIKVLKRMAYGYRNEQYFQLKILRRCGYLKTVQPVF